MKRQIKPGFERLNLKYSKKGAVVGLLISFGFLAAIALFFYFLTTTSPIRDYIGESQMQLLIQAKQAEKAQTYIEQSAKFATTQSIYELAKDSSNCSTYYGFSVWSNQTTNCIPSQETIKKRLSEIINDKLNNYFEAYEEVTIPTNNYDLFITPTKLKIFGSAKNDLTISTLSLYKNVLITTYYVPSEKDFEKWYTGVDYKQYSGYEIYGWCVIPFEKRGFYEDVKCEGSGVSATGKEVYSYKTITPEKETSKTTNKIYTATGAEAKAHETIAVAPNMIPYGSKVEIKFTDCEDVECCKQWEGEYIAQDTGIAMRKDWERGIPHIDVFAGIGREDYLKSSCISGKHADVTVKSEKIEGKGSVYTIKPNFKTELDYDLNEYEKLSAELKTILDEVKKKKCIADLPNTDCVKNFLKDYKGNFEWSYNCLPEEKQVFYDFIESMELCNKDGICNVQIPTTEKEYEITLTKEKDKIIAKLNKQTYEMKIKGIGATRETLNSLDSCDKELKFKISKNKISVKGSCSSFNPDFEYQTSMPVLVKGGVIYAISNKLEKPEEVMSYERYTPKGLLKLCAKSSHKNYFYDEYDDKTIERNIVYKIAVFAGDLEAPEPVENLNVVDTTKAENNGTVTFDENKAENDVDVDRYNIYYSENMFEDVKYAKFLASVKDDNDPDKNGYITTVNLADGSYYFAVTAVDTSGNENTTVTAKKAVLIDDLNPAPAKLEAEKTSTNIKFTITRPYENEDGSDIEDLKIFWIYKFSPVDGRCDLNNVPSLSQSNLETSVPWNSFEETTATISSSESNVCYVVISDDEYEEPLEEKDRGKRYNQESIAGPI